MANRVRVSSGTEWEATVGYSRALRVGNLVEVAGTTAVDEEGHIIGIENPYAQAQYIFGKIERALAEVGASLQDVVRTRMYVTDITFWEEIGRAHGERFRDSRPVATMVGVSALIDPRLLVEVEVTAIVEDDPAGR